MAIKPGTPHPNRKGMVMGKNGRYVSKTTYNKQVKAAKTSTAKPEKGGALTKTTQAKPDNPRRTRALAKQAKAAKGTKSSGTRVAQPTQKALPPGKSGGALAKTAKGAKGVAAKVAVPLAMVNEVNAMVDRAKRDAERNKKLNRRPFEKLRADSRTRQGKAKRRGQGSGNKPRSTDMSSKSNWRDKVGSSNVDKLRKGQNDTIRSYADKTPTAKPKAKPTPKPAAKKPAPKPPTKPTTKPAAKKPAYEGPGSRGQAPGGYAGKPKKQSLKSQVEELKKMRMAAEARNKAAAAKKKEEEKKKKRTMGSRKPGSMY